MDVTPYLPARTFLDRSIVDLFARYGDWIVEGSEAGIDEPDALSEELVEHLNALRAIFAVNERANFQFITAEASLAQPIESGRGMFWATQLSEISDELLAANGPTAESRQRADDFAAQELRWLTEEGRFQVRYAILTRCDAYISVDPSLTSRQTAPSVLHIQFYTPNGYWAMLQPWAKLWR